MARLVLLQRAYVTANLVAERWTWPAWISHRNNIMVDGASSVLGVAGITSLGGTALTVNTPGMLTFNDGDRSDGLELDGAGRRGLWHLRRQRR
jgi:hypothetical protein